MRKIYYYTTPNDNTQRTVWLEKENVYRYTNTDEVVERVPGDSIRIAYRYYYDVNEVYIVYAGSLDSDLITLDENGRPIFYTFNPYGAEFQTVNELYVMTPTVELYPEVTKDNYYLLEDRNFIRKKLNVDVPDYGSESPVIYYVANFKLHSDIPFYQSNKYYYQGKDQKSWYHDTNGAFNPNTIYYDLTGKIKETEVSFELNGKVLYEPGKYYYKKYNRYYIDNSATPTKDQYYTGNNDFFVCRDDKGTLSYGSHWNSQLPVPHYIELGVKTSTIATMKELVGFSKGLNTIHGLILQINNFLEYGNETTRNTSTVQGVVNSLNDLITNFAILDYGQFVVTDSYGRMHTAEAADDKWINSYIEPDVETPIVHVHHTFNPGENTISTIDLNDTQDDEIVIEELQPDAMGHITHKNTKTVTLPFGIKKINADNGSYSAPTTQSDFNIKTKDKWLNTTINNNELLIEHEDAQTAEHTAGLIQDTSPKYGEAFVIPKISIDGKGHVKDLEDFSITLPSISLTSDEGNVVSNITLDSTTGAFTETKVNIGTIALGTYQSLSDNSDILATDSISTAIGKNAYKLSILNGDENTVGSLLQEAKTRSTADEDLSNKIQDLNTKIIGIGDRVKTLEDADFETAISGINNKIKTLEDLRISSRLSQLENNYNDLNTRITTNDTQISSLGNNINDIKTNIQELTTLCNNQKATIETLTQRIEALEGKTT